MPVLNWIKKDLASMEEVESANLVIITDANKISMPKDEDLLDIYYRIIPVGFG